MKLEIYSKFAFYLTAIFIAIFSLLSLNFNKSVEISDLSFRFDYLFHFIAYFFLALFLVFWKKEKNPDRSLFVFLIAFGVFYSAVFEIIQIFITNRVFNPLDFLFNLFGFAAGIVSFLVLRRKYGRN